MSDIKEEMWRYKSHSIHNDRFVGDKKRDILPRDKTAVVTLVNEKGDNRTERYGFVHTSLIYAMIERKEPINLNGCFVDNFSMPVYRKKRDRKTDSHVEIIDFKGKFSLFLRLSFKGISFYGSTDFRNSSFAGFVEFTGSTFFEYANFNETIFSGAAIFESTKFKKIASFRVSKFWETAGFSNSVFSESADFRDSLFNRFAVFYKSKFSNFAYFSDSKILGEVIFYSSTFLRSAYFDAIEFSEPADFSVCKFSGFTSFRATSFSSKSSFKTTTFNDEVDFQDATFKLIANFNNLRAKKINFSGAIFEEHGLFLGTIIDKGNSETFRTIKHEFLKVNNRIQSAKFHKHELQSFWQETKKEYDFESQKTTWENIKSFPNLVSLSFYKISNNFGSNWIQALLFTLASSLIFYTLYVAFGISRCVPELFSCDFWSYYIDFLKPTRSAEFIKCTTVNCCGKLLDVVGRVLIGYGFYQTITPFRKYKM